MFKVVGKSYIMNFVKFTVSGYIDVFDIFLSIVKVATNHTLPLAPEN